ncbi:MAG TPA: hypothetical protein VFD70_00260 [Anaerolineae bacterium]|nr:hypothetical protein [Anaerolineae bacterium]
MHLLTRPLVRYLVLLGLGIWFLAFVWNAPTFAEPSAVPAQDLTVHVFLPLLTSSTPNDATCDNFAGDPYAAITVNPPPTDRPADQHADLNLALRGYKATTGTLGLIDYGGSTDLQAPKLYSLFADNRVPTFSSVSQVYDWEWTCNCRGNPITDPVVSLAGMGVTPGEAMRVPTSQYNIGTVHVRPARGFFEDWREDDPNAYEVLVLYAAPNRITLKYTREDNVVRGYTLHIENVCVASNLLQLYQQWNTAGRAQLPALKAGQTFARAQTNEIGVVIRDNGSFMDPRSRKDWW